MIRREKFSLNIFFAHTKSFWEGEYLKILQPTYFEKNRKVDTAFSAFRGNI